MADFARNGPTQAELDDAKTYLTGSFPMAFASNTGIAAQLGTFQRQNLDIGYLTRRNSLIQAVTLNDVRRVARRFDPARLTIMVAGSPAGAAAPQRPKPPLPPETPPAQAAKPTPAPAAAAQTPAKPVDKPVSPPPSQPSR